MIVEEESGVIVSKFGKDRMRATELVAYVKSTKGLEATREFSDVELNCSKLSVVAAKKAGK